MKNINKINIDEHYDYLIVGSGIFGSTCARLLKDKGKKVLVVEKQSHIGGNVYTQIEDDIIVHVYGAHIFHTDNEKIWEFVNRFDEMMPFINSPIANYKGELYHLPFNMNTFHELWGVNTVEEAKAKIQEQVEKEGIKNPKNLEEHVLSLAGRDVYTKLVKGYTEKQWGRSCKDLPSSIIKRLPFRFEYNNNYFNDKYQGIPKNGYTRIIENMLDDIEILLDTDYLKNKEELKKVADKIIYTGPIDVFFDYKEGQLEYRSLKFDTQKLQIPSYQNMPVMNFTSHNEAYTRIIEHKFFDKNCKNNTSTIITKEYPASYEETKTPYYPINDEKNNDTYEKYEKLASSLKNIYFGGRLGLYKYFDMDDAILKAFELIESID